MNTQRIDLDRLEAEAQDQYGMDLLACQLIGVDPQKGYAAIILDLIAELRTARQSLALGALSSGDIQKDRERRSVERDLERVEQIRESRSIVRAWHEDDEEMRVPDDEWGTTFYHAVGTLLEATRGED